MAGELTGWNPDPYGVHEMRFFSDDGRATLLVRDGDVRSYDRPPSEDEIFVWSSEPVPESRSLGNPAAELESPVGHVWPVQEHAPGSNGNSAPPDAAELLPLPACLSPPDVFEAPRADAPAMSRTAKVAYIVVLAAMATSAVVLAAVHFDGHKAPHQSLGTTSTTSKTPASTASTAPTTTVPPPPGLQPSAPVAAADLISAWASGNQATAASVATPPAVTALFAAHNTNGLAISRGCSVQISATIPVVCTYGPPGGANPADAIYQLSVSQASGGWYVSAVKIEN
jgi:hypothetical protein